MNPVASAIAVLACALCVGCVPKHESVRACPTIPVTTTVEVVRFVPIDEDLTKTKELPDEVSGSSSVGELMDAEKVLRSDLLQCYSALSDIASVQGTVKPSGD